MSHLPTLPPDATLLDVFRAHPGPVGPLLELHEQVMRAESPLSAGRRELIAAYVSAVNGCAYCHGVHAATATAFGISCEVLPAALEDLDTAPIEEDMRPLLRYVDVLTRRPNRVGQAEVDAVLAAGWDSRALHDAVAVCALFNFMNRLVDGLGLPNNEAYAQLAGSRLAEIGYRGLADLL